MKLKELILEGMYDKLTGEINKAIFTKVKDAIKGSGSEESPKKYKGYVVRKNPTTNTSLQDYSKMKLVPSMLVSSTTPRVVLGLK